VLGRVSAVSLDEAREGYARKDEAGRQTNERGARELYQIVRHGGHPAADKALKQVRASNTFGELTRQFLEFQKRELRPRSYAEVKRHLEQNVRQFHKLPLTSINLATVAGRLNHIAKDSGDVTANRTRASMSAMFGWAMEQGLADANPVMNTGKREERSRDRVLSDAELAIIWNALLADHYGSIVKLLILTGQRANEIAGLQRPEMDFERDMITLPADRTKNNRAHEIPMSPAVRAILEAQPKIDERIFLFGYGDGPFSGWSKSKLSLDERITKATGKALTHWTVHDLRRTAATSMANDLGILPHVIEAVLNHVSGHKGGIAGIYNKATYRREKAEALALWGDHITALVEKRKSNITPFPRSA
jgi:integrase